MCSSSISGVRSDPSGNRPSPSTSAPLRRSRRNRSTDSGTFPRIARVAAKSGDETSGNRVTPRFETSAPPSSISATAARRASSSPPPEAFFSENKPTAMPSGNASFVSSAAACFATTFMGASQSARDATKASANASASARARASRLDRSVREPPSPGTSPGTYERRSATDARSASAAASRVSRCATAMAFADATASASARADQRNGAPIAIGDQEPIRASAPGEAPPSEPAFRSAFVSRNRSRPRTTSASNAARARRAAGDTSGTPETRLGEARNDETAEEAEEASTRLDGTFAASLSVTLAGHQSRSSREEGWRARPRSAATHMASAGVPGRQCPGLEPTASGSAPSFRSLRAAATAGAPAPSAAAHAACHRGGPDAGAAAPVSPTARRRARNSRLVGTCVNVVTAPTSTADSFSRERVSPVSEETSSTLRELDSETAYACESRVSPTSARACSRVTSRPCVCFRALTSASRRPAERRTRDPGPASAPASEREELFPEDSAIPDSESESESAATRFAASNVAASVALGLPSMSSSVYSKKRSGSSPYAPLAAHASCSIAAKAIASGVRSSPHPCPDPGRVPRASRSAPEAMRRAATSTHARRVSSGVAGDVAATEARNRASPTVPETPRYRVHTARNGDASVPGDAPSRHRAFTSAPPATSAVIAFFTSSRRAGRDGVTRSAP